ncbi:Peroxyureidoacrylate/ureidoacrylate amidohydrolase RutB [compost metagenome]
MHPVGIRPEIAERVIKRRQRLHLFDVLEARKSALVVIDMQGTFCEPGAPAEVPASRSICGNINRMAAAVRKAGGRVVWCTHANLNTNSGSDWKIFFENIVAGDIRKETIKSLEPSAPGQRIWHEMQVEPEDIQLFKNRYSALIPGSSQLERILRSLDIDTLLIAGTKTNICCESTARDAMMLDFKCVMLSDCTASLSDEEHSSALENIIQQFGDVYTCEEAIARLA